MNNELTTCLCIYIYIYEWLSEFMNDWMVECQHDWMNVQVEVVVLRVLAALFPINIFFCSGKPLTRWIWWELKYFLHICVGKVYNCICLMCMCCYSGCIKIHISMLIINQLISYVYLKYKYISIKIFYFSYTFVESVN